MKEKLFEYPIFVLFVLAIIAVSFQMIFKNSIVFTSICCILIIFYLYCQTTYQYNKIPQIKKDILYYLSQIELKIRTEYTFQTISIKTWTDSYYPSIINLIENEKNIDEEKLLKVLKFLNNDLYIEERKLQNKSIEEIEKELENKILMKN